MLNKTLNYLLIALFSVSFLACGGGSSSSDGTNTGGGTPSTPTTPTSFPTPDVTETFGTDGNLYKPVSDETASGGGNMVVLLSAKYTTQFDTCKIRNNAGQIVDLFCLNSVPWTQIPFSCFSNGNRQTWRANFRCSSVGEVRVSCQDSVRTVEFVAPGGATGNVCSRFG